MLKIVENFRLEYKNLMKGVYLKLTNINVEEGVQQLRLYQLDEQSRGSVDLTKNRGRISKNFSYSKDISLGIARLKMSALKSRSFSNPEMVKKYAIVEYNDFKIKLQITSEMTLNEITEAAFVNFIASNSITEESIIDMKKEGKKIYIL